MGEFLVNFGGDEYKIEIPSFSESTEIFTLRALCKSRLLKFEEKFTKTQLNDICEGSMISAVFDMLKTSLTKTNPRVNLTHSFCKKDHVQDKSSSYREGDSLLLILKYTPEFVGQELVFYFPLKRKSELEVGDLAGFLPQTGTTSTTATTASQSQIDISTLNNLKQEIEKLKQTIEVMKIEHSYTKSHANRLNKIEDAVFTGHTKQESPVHYAKLAGGTCSGNGAYWAWATVANMDSEYFQYTNANLVILKEGAYIVMIRTGVTTSANAYMALYSNGAAIATCYSSNNAGLQTSFVVDEIFKFAANTKLQVYQTYNTAPINNDPNNHFTVLRLGN